MNIILDPERIGWHKQTTKERFWSKVDIRSKNECWNWTGHSLNKRGYGAFKLPTGDSRGGINVLSHRYSYFLETGYYPTQKEYICHKCDNPACVNPRHLFLGNQFVNMRDMVSKGRNSNVKGSKNPNAKIDENSAFEIKELHKLGVSGYKLSKIYKISKTQMSRILRGENWSS